MTFQNRFTPATRGRVAATHAFATLAALILVAAPTPAEAVRPFVTDDARIADYGQIEGETWFDFLRQDGRILPIYNALINVIPLDWLELGFAGGIGWDTDDSVTLLNPGLQFKLLFAPPGGGWLPGFSLVVGMTTPWGRGSQHMDAWGAYVIAPMTLSFADDDVLIHGNLGWTGGFGRAGSDERRAFGRSHGRFFWGLGTDLAMWHSDARFVLEVFAGEPLDPFGASLAGQTGFRWLVSDHLNLDVAVTLTERLDADHRGDGIDWSLQVGVRFLIDAFTRDGRPGSPLGAPGMVQWRPEAEAR